MPNRHADQTLQPNFNVRHGLMPLFIVYYDTFTTQSSLVEQAV